MGAGRRHVNSALLVACAVAMLAAPNPTAQSSPSDRLVAALELYGQGEAARAIPSQVLADADVATVIGQLEAWAPAPADKGAAPTARQRTALRFVVDAIASSPMDQMWYGVPIADGAPMGNRLRIGIGDTLVRRPWAPRFPDQGVTLPVVAWACDLMPKSGPVEPWERWWWLTSIAVLQQAGEWGALIGHSRAEYSGTPPPPWRARTRSEAQGDGHLAHARARIGVDARLRLAEAVSRAASVTDATARFTIEPGRRLILQHGRFDVIRNLEESVSALNSDRFSDLERDFVALLGEPALEGEVALRIAQLRLLRKDWRDAQQWLDRTSAATTDPFLLATTDYFKGWVFERTGQATEALAAYRRAYARQSRSPNLSSLYAVQLMLAGERSEAARVLDATMRAGSANQGRDLWHVLVSGDGRMSATLALKMRDAR